MGIESFVSKLVLTLVLSLGVKFEDKKWELRALSVT